MVGDINWEDYGGSWGRKLRDGVWIILRFENKAEWGDGASGYHCDVLQVDLTTLPEASLQSALQSCGHELKEIDDEQCIVTSHTGDIEARKRDKWFEAMLIDCCMGYGCYAPLDSTEGGSYPLRVRAEARRIADSYFADQIELNRRLNRPVNAIGSTAREFGKGDMQSAMDRLKDPPVKIKVIRRKLTSECWMIQIWGPDYCNTCEYINTPDCGGQEILKTGENEKGIEVGKQGL